MMSYTHLTQEERYQIYAYKQAGLSLSAIADAMGRHKSTISREIRRNTGQRGYRPAQAQRLSLARVPANGKVFSPENWRLVASCLREHLSPEQISGRLKAAGTLHISHETIYLYIYADKKQGGDLYQYLRCQKKRRKRYKSGRDLRGRIVNRVDISERPPIVLEKSRIGDWEADTVIGQNHKGAIMTIVDRVSRFTCAKLLETKEAASVAQAIIESLLPFENQCHTITYDNGKEFAAHEAISKALKCNGYFARPYHSWERGCNENTNGLLRQFFPKKTDFTKISQEQVQDAINTLNHRPRKCLGYKTPFEVFTGHKSSWLNQEANVALQI